MLGPIKTVAIYVEDQDRSVEFYTHKLGFHVRRSMPMGPDAHWIELAPTGAQTALVLYPRAMKEGWEQMKPSVVFHCPDVEAECQKLAAMGVAIKMKPTALPWGLFAIITDPDGNDLGMTSQPLA